MLELAREATGRNHGIHFATTRPALEDWLQQLRNLGATWGTIDSLGSNCFQVRTSVETQFDVVGLHLIAPRSSHAIGSYLARGVGVVFVDHISDEGLDDSGALEKHIQRWADRATIEFIDRYVGISQYVTERSIRRFGGSTSRYQTIYNGVAVDRYIPRSQSADEVQITTVAHLIPQKGIAILLEACAKLRGRRFGLNIVGDGPQRARLERLARDRDLTDRIRFLGLRNDTEVILGATDIFVHPALWNEAFGYTVAEAMSAGCAVVASNVGALPELLDESSGLLVPPGSPDALSKALLRLLDDDALRLQMGSAARDRVLKRFDVRDSATAHISICEQVAHFSANKG